MVPNRNMSTHYSCSKEAYYHQSPPPAPFLMNTNVFLLWRTITSNVEFESNSLLSSGRLRQELCAETKKTRKTRETKTWITQNFPIVWPIQGSTMSNSMPRAFQICMTHGGKDDLYHSFWPPKSRQMSTKNFRAWLRYKKLTLLNEASVRFETNSTSCQ